MNKPHQHLPPSPESIALGLVAFGLYAAALFLPTLVLELDKRQEVKGWLALIIGFLEIRESIIQIYNAPLNFMHWNYGFLFLLSMIPNVLFFVGEALLLTGWRDATWRFGEAGLALTLWALLDYANMKNKFPPILVGYWFWIASFACLTVAGLLQKRRYRVVQNTAQVSE